MPLGPGDMRDDQFHVRRYLPQQDLKSNFDFDMGHPQH